MPNEGNHNYIVVLCECHQLQKLLSDIEAGLQCYVLQSGHCKHTWIYMKGITISWKAYEIDTRSFVTNNDQWLGYKKEK